MNRLLDRVLSRWSFSALTLGVAFSGCSSTGPDSGIDGTFKLSRFNDLPVPANMFQLPDINGQPTNCWKAVSEGTLTLTVTTLAFVYTVVFRNSCNQQVLESDRVEGRFEISGNDVTLFVVDGTVPGGERTITTTHVGNVIGIHPSSDTYYYIKQ